MARREYRRPGETIEWNATEVEAYLRNAGFLLGPSGLGVGVEAVDGVTSVVVSADLDANLPDATIAAALDRFTPTPDPQRTARGYLLGRMRTIKGKPAGQRSVAENDLLALLTVLRQDG